MTMAICLETFRYSLAFHESEGRSCLCLGLFCLIQFCFSVISVFMYWCLFLAKVFSRTSSVCICCFIPSVLRFCHLLKFFRLVSCFLLQVLFCFLLLLKLFVSLKNFSPSFLFQVQLCSHWIKLVAASPSLLMMGATAPASFCSRGAWLSRESDRDRYSSYPCLPYPELGPSYDEEGAPYSAAGAP